MVDRPEYLTQPKIDYLWQAYLDKIPVRYVAEQIKRPADECRRVVRLIEKQMRKI